MGSMIMLVEQRVKSVHKSPMNPKQWCLTLECGHEVWVTSKSKPERKIVACDACKKAANK